MAGMAFDTCFGVQVKHVCRVAEEMQRMGKCIVIGLQSTGEARTLDVVEVKYFFFIFSISISDP